MQPLCDTTPWWTFFTDIIYGWYTSKNQVRCVTCGRTFRVGADRRSAVPYCSIPCSIVE